MYSLLLVMVTSLYEWDEKPLKIKQNEKVPFILVALYSLFLLKYPLIDCRQSCLLV